MNHVIFLVPHFQTNPVDDFSYFFRLHSSQQQRLLGFNLWVLEWSVVCLPSPQTGTEPRNAGTGTCCWLKSWAILGAKTSIWSMMAHYSHYITFIS